MRTEEKKCWLSVPDEVALLPATAGSYILEFNLGKALTVCPGRLGIVLLGPGRLRYYGSARGLGGLKARIVRHLGRDGRRPHWHIDALTALVPVVRVMLSSYHTECDLVQQDLRSGKWIVAALGFGSSDCRRSALRDPQPPAGTCRLGHSRFAGAGVLPAVAAEAGRRAVQPLRRTGPG